MKKKLLSVLMAAVMVAGVGGVGAAQVKADDEKILGAVILACPSLRATLAIDTPANNNNEAWVCLSPCMEISDIPHLLQCLVSTSFTVEL